MFLKIMKIILETILLIHLLSLHSLIGSTKSTECLIHNNAYKFDYLYPSSELHIKYNPLRIRYIYASSLSRVKSLDTLRWKIIQIKGTHFYLKSVKYPNEYMCASSSHSDLLRRKRRLQTKLDINSTMMNIGKECEWSIERSITNNGYNIWNVLYQEPMYSTSYYFKFESEKRNVFLWHKSPDSAQFEWIIDCKVGDFFRNYKYFV